MSTLIIQSYTVMMSDSELIALVAVLRSFCLTNRITNAQLAEVTGYNRQTVNKILNNRTTLTGRNVMTVKHGVTQIAKALGIEDVEQQIEDAIPKKPLAVEEDDPAELTE